MIPGDITGNIYWNDKDTSMLRRFVSKGKSLMGSRFLGITLKTPQLPGYRCEACGTIMFVERR